MHIKIEGQTQDFVPIQTFRARWGLPDDFNLARFEPKDWTGLGSIAQSGPLLAGIRLRVVQAVPSCLSLPDLMQTADDLTGIFRRELQIANTRIGLRPVEVDFAVAGFHDVLRGVVYHLVQLHQQHSGQPQQVQERFDFEAVYQAWLDDSVRVGAAEYTYARSDTSFTVRVVYNAYGRVGLAVTLDAQRYYVVDQHLACPAAGYMHDLCRETSHALCRAFATTLT